MGKNIKITGRLRMYLQASIILGILLVAVNIAVSIVNLYAGTILGVFTIIYLIVVLILFRVQRKLIIDELISFATEYGQIQKQLLRDLELPHALVDEKGKVIWTNKEFEKIAGIEKGYRKSIISLFPELQPDKFPEGDLVESEVDFSHNEHFYHVKMKKMEIKNMLQSSPDLHVEDYEGCMVAIYLFDETALQFALKENDDQSLAVGLMYIDNFDEALDSVEEVRRALLVALIDRKVNKHISSMDGIVKKLEKDKYLLIMRKKSLNQMQESRFELLEDVKTVNIGNEMSVTLSIGIGLDGITYSQNYEYARSCIDLALARGGDQAVIKTPDNIVYYGGKSKQVEKNTRVKARVKAQAIREIIDGKEEVFVMGHRFSDVDCFGAAIGVYCIARALEKPIRIVINDISSSIEPMINLFKDNPDYPEDMFINSTQALAMVSDQTALIIVDTNKPSITDCPELIKECKEIVVIDHHRQGTEVVDNATLSYVEPYASSASEMTAEILQYVADNVKIRGIEADCIYSGIMIDTNNFMQKTGVRTFEAAAYLRRNGADVTRVRKLFREDPTKYIVRARAVSQAEIYKYSYAFSICDGDSVSSPTIVGAQAANELLDIKGIRASFIFTEYQGQVFLSARSIDEVNVQIVTERLGGGGHMNVAGAQFEDMTIDDAMQLVKNTLDQMEEEGAI